MSLIVVPVGAGEGIASLRHLARILSSGAPPSRRAPLVIAPEQCDGWSEVAAEAAAAGVSLSIDPAVDAGTRVERALAMVQSQRLASNGGAGDGDALVIVPLFHAAHRDDLAPALASLETLVASIDVALKTAFRSTAAVGFPNVYFVPWVFLPDSESILGADSLFKAPESIAGGLCKPLVRFAERRGTRSEWEGHGEMQLAIDLLVLSAIASGGGELTARLRRETSDRAQFAVSHAATVELPWTTTARIGVLRALVGDDQPPLVAESAAPPAAAAAAPGEGAAPPPGDDSIASSLRTLIEKKYVSDSDFRTGNGWLGVEVSIVPFRHEFTELKLDRRADRVHDDLMLRLEANAAEMVSRKGGEAVADAQKTLADIESAIELRLQSRLTASDVRGPIGGNAIGAATAIAHSLQEIVDSAARTNPDTLERIVEEARQQRDSWQTREQTLWQQASRIPQHWAVIAATAAVGFSLLLAASIVFRGIGWLRNWPPWIVTVCTAVAAGGLTALFYVSNEKRVRRYFEQWSAFEDSIDSSLQVLCNRLAALCNQRVATMKVASVPGLLRRLVSAVNRLRTEIAGVTSICREQLAADERAQTAATRAPEAGRFYYGGTLADPEPEVVPRTMRRVLSESAARLKEAPRWVPIEEWRSIIDAHVAEVVAKRGVSEDAKKAVEKAAAYARSEDFVPVFNDAQVAELSAEHLILCGTAVRRDVDDRQARTADVLPQELAVFFSLRSYEMVSLSAEAV